MARTIAEVEADLVSVRAARSQIIAGERVTEIWRDGRRLTFEKMTLDDCRKLLADLEGELALANEMEASGTTRRRYPIGLRYSN